MSLPFLFIALKWFQSHHEQCGYSTHATCMLTTYSWVANFRSAFGFFGFSFWQPLQDCLAVNWIVYCFQLSRSRRSAQIAICQRWWPYCWSLILTWHRPGALCALQHVHQATCFITICIKTVNLAATISQLSWPLSAWWLTRLVPDPTSIRKAQAVNGVHKLLNPLLHSHHHHLASSIVLSSQLSGKSFWECSGPVDG